MGRRCLGTADSFGPVHYDNLSFVRGGCAHSLAFSGVRPIACYDLPGGHRVTQLSEADYVWVQVHAARLARLQRGLVPKTHALIVASLIAAAGAIWLAPLPHTWGQLLLATAITYAGGLLLLHRYATNLQRVLLRDYSRTQSGIAGPCQYRPRRPPLLHYSYTMGQQRHTACAPVQWASHVPKPGGAFELRVVPDHPQFSAPVLQRLNRNRSVAIDTMRTTLGVLLLVLGGAALLCLPLVIYSSYW